MTAWERVHVEVNQAASHLEETAAVIRRYAGTLRYHPVTGLATPPPAEVWDALGRLRESLAQVAGWLAAFAQETAALAPGSDVLSGEVQEGPQRIRARADLLRAALDGLERVLAHPERTPLDAPYGLGAPRQPHPGAQATWVAERAEALARELATQVVLRENLTAQGERGRAP